MAENVEPRRQESPVDKQESQDDSESGMLSCRLFAVIAGAVFMALVVLFGVPKEDKQHLLSTTRPGLPAAPSAHPAVPGAWSGFSRGFGLANQQRPAIQQDKSSSPGSAGVTITSRPLLCVVSRAATQPIQFPRTHCTHIVYQDVTFNQASGKFTPVNEATFGALGMLIGVTKQKVLVAVADLESKRDAEARSLASALATWLPKVNFNGAAVLGIDTTSDKLADLVPAFKEIHASLSQEKLEFLAAVFIRDWDIPSNLIVGRLAAITPHVDYLVLETHYHTHFNACHTAYTSVFYSSGLTPSPTVPIGQALTWMASLMTEQRQYVTSCFSIGLGAVIYRDADRLQGTCITSDVASYMQVCKGTEWRPDEANLDALSLLRLGRGRAESHEADPLLTSKINHALANFPRACVVAYDVDLDDYEGQCGNEPFARLEALRRAEVRNDPEMAAQAAAKSPNEELRKRCMPAGKENVRPLVCVLSDRIDLDRNVSKLFCTHIVLSLRRYGKPDGLNAISKEYVAQLRNSAASGVRVLVAPHESALEASHERDAMRLAEATAVQLKGKQLDGLAFLHVARTSAALADLTPTLEVLHETYKTANLCLALSIQILDPSTPANDVSRSLSLVAKHVDLLVVNSHYPGRLGPCRAVPLASAAQPTRSCVPTVAADTAVQWLKDVTEKGISLACLSVDLRALRFSTYGKTAPFGSCRQEFALDFSSVCTAQGWNQVHNASRDTPMWQSDLLLQTYDTASSLAQRVRSILTLPNAGIAAFNLDYEDYSGVCEGGVPQARLMAIRAALDDENITAQSKLTLATPDRPLLCVLSSGVSNESRVPTAHCTHLVHEGAKYAAADMKLVIPEQTIKLAETIKNQHHIVGLDGNSLVDVFLQASDKELNEIAATMASAVLGAKMNGLAILNFNRTSKTIANFGRVLEVMRSVFAKELTIIFGAEVLDYSLPTEIMAERLTKAAKNVDIFVLQTHYRRSRGYCRITYPSTYKGDAPIATLTSAAAWSRAMEVRSRVCLSYTMGVLQFETETGGTLAAAPPACHNVSVIDRSEACDDKDWEVEANNTNILSVVRRKNKFLQTFESAQFLTEKVSKIFSENPGSCVALFNVDLEEATGTCGNLRTLKFARLAAVAEKYIEIDSRTKSKHQLLPRLTEAVPDDTVNDLAGYLPSGPTQRPVGLRARTTVYRPDILGTPLGRPFICFLSPKWTNSSVSPVPSHCTHVVLSAEPLSNPDRVMNNSNREAALDNLARSLRRDVKLFVRTQGWRDFAAEAPALLEAMKLSYAEGVALTDIHILSTEARNLALSLQKLTEQLGKDTRLMLGLEIADYDDAGALLTQRLAPLYEFADILVLQTHLRAAHTWPFCRTAYSSLFDHPADDSCLQTTPTVTALSWIKTLQPFAVPTCISFNMAAVKFRTAGNATIDSPCEDSLESDDICSSQKWSSATDSSSVLSSYRSKDGASVTVETAELLREKLTRAYGLYSRFCVALYNVDVDAQPCEGSDVSFARVAQVAEAARFKPLGTPPAPATDEDPDWSAHGQPLPKTAVQNATSSHALVCILSASALNLDRFPMRLCSYVVYTRRITPGAPPQPFVPENDPKFSMFVRRCERTKSRGLVAVIPSTLATLFDKNSLAIMPFAVSAMTNQLDKLGLAGLAVFATPSADLDQLSNRTRQLYELLDGKYKLVVGVHTTDFNDSRLKDLSKSSHLLVLFTHSMLRGSNCTVAAPSSIVLNQSHFETMKQIASSGGERLPSTCVSVNFAVMGFKTRSSNTTLGDACVNRRLESYDRTCWVTDEGLALAPRGVHQRNSSWVQTFETERSIDDAVRPFLETYPGGCAAAVYADFDDPAGTCRPRYSRLHGLSQLMVSPSTEGGPTAAPSEEETSQLTQRNKMICFVEPSSQSVSNGFPADSCDYVVLSTQNFTAIENVTHLFGNWKDTMTKLAPKTRVALGINAHTLVSLYKSDYASGVLLVESMPSWLKPNGGRAVAVLAGTLASQDELLLFRILRDLRNSLTSTKDAVPDLILAVSSASELFHKELIDLCDVFVLVDHHIPGTLHSCHVTFPSVSPRTSSLTSPMLITKDLIQKGMEHKTFCVSLNLAVLKFATHATSAARGGRCDSEAEVGYSEVCRLSKKVPVFDMNWMTASLSDSKQLYTFEKSEMLLSKVLFLKAWFPTLCVATFHTEMDAVDASACPHTQQYERLQSIRKGLDSAVHGGNRPWKSYAEDGA